MTSGKKRPLAEANRLTKFLELGSDETDRYPVNVKKIALELTPSFNKDPITAVESGSMGSIEGALVKKENAAEWAIFYNSDIAHQGRRNFTLAHELGHYMVHRHERSSGRFDCSEKDILGNNTGTNDIEAEANAFAATLLMPNQDFRSQVNGQKFSFDLISHCANRYDVSSTAAILKWLDIADTPAIALLSEDGMMHWSKSNNKAFRSGKYFATRKNIIPVPDQSLAATETDSEKARKGVRHDPGIWFPEESVVEYTFHSVEHAKTLTVLTLGTSGGYTLPKDFDEDSELLTDTYTNFIDNGQEPY